MLSIELANSQSLHLTTLYNWFNDKWDDMKVFSETKNGNVIPNPIIALNGDEFISLLCFSSLSIVIFKSSVSKLHSKLFAIKQNDLMPLYFRGC